MTFAHALKWSFLAELAIRAIQPLVFVILAALLAPEDFGVMAAALMVIAFSQIFWEAGMSQALIQRGADLDDAANAAFWINIGLSVAVAAALYLAAGPVARAVFHDERVTAVLQVMTIHLVLSAACSVHLALLQKQMHFKRLFWVRFLSASLPALASVPLALHGAGYWALVAGALAGQAVQVLALWRASQWRPRLSFNAAVAGEIGGFGAWVSLSGLLAWFYMWCDSLIVSMYLGSHDLGLYRTGNQFVMLIFNLLFGPVTPVLYSYLVRMAQDGLRMRRTAENIVKALSLVAIPAAWMLYSLGQEMEGALFGEQWQGIGFVIGVMALMHGFSWVVGMNGEIYRALGKPAWETAVMAASLAIYLGAYLVSIEQGFVAFVWARLALALAAVLLHLVLLRMVIAIALPRIVRYLLVVTIVSGAAVFAVQTLVFSLVGGAWERLVLAGALNIAVLAGAALLMERRGVLRDLRLA